MAIVLFPVGAIDQKILADLRADLPPLLRKPVQLKKGLGAPLYAYHPGRKQFHSTAILQVLLKNQEFLSDERILGLVDHDLFVPELNFVFGEASRRAAVMALPRLRETFYGRPEDSGRFRRRVLTEAVHELGHTYGLGHCRRPSCVMFFSNRLEDTDRKGPGFCPECRQRYDALPGSR